MLHSHLAFYGTKQVNDVSGAEDVGDVDTDVDADAVCVCPYD